MIADNINIHIARKKMRLKNANFCLSFINTVWNGEVIMCCFNNNSKNIVDIFCVQDMSKEDVESLENLIKEFLLEVNHGL